MSKVLDACIARAQTLLVADTGSMALRATAEGYTRILTGTSGEPTFQTDGFEVGMEIMSTGFPKDPPTGIVMRVTDSFLGIKGGRTAAASAVNRRLRVSLPVDQIGTNEDYEGTTGVAFAQFSLVDNGGGMIEVGSDDAWRSDFSLFVVGWWGISGTGEKGLRSSVEALAALFSPNTVLAVGDGTYVRVPTGQKPTLSPLINPTAGRALITLSVPLRRFVQNAVLA